MTQYFTNFEDSDIADDAPLGWTKRLAAGSAPSSYPRVVAMGTPQFKRQQVSTSQSAGGLGLITWDTLDADANRANIEIRALYQYPSSNGDSDKGIIVRGTGSAGSGNFYYMTLETASNRVNIGRFNGGAFSAVLGFSSFTLSAGTDYIFVFSVQGTGATVTLNAKVFQAGTTEPSAWTLSVTDTSGSRHTAAGWNGVFNQGNGKTGGWNFVSAGTNGEAALGARLNAEFLTYTKTKANPICVLADLAATGYDVSAPPYTKTVHAHLSTEPYVSTVQQTDLAAGIQYQPIIAGAPTFRRELAEALYGEASVDLGNLVITNPQDPATGAGVRDDYLRARWQSGNVVIWLGAPDWPRHDFRKVVVGRLAQPVAPKMGEISFALSGLAEMLDIPLQTNYYANTVAGLENQQKPILLGQPLYIEPPKIDEVTNQYQMHDGACAGEPVVYDEGIALTGAGGTISAVDTGTDTITTGVPHGMVQGYAVTLSGSLPAPLSSGTYYWVKTTPTTSSFTLAATEGGATINLTTSTTGGLVEGFGWWPVLDSPDGCFKLAAPAAGRVVVESAQQSPAGTSNIVANMIEWLVFTKAGISANFKDAATFTALAASGPSAAGVWFEPGTAVSVKDALFQVAQGAFCWAGWSPDGLLQVGEISLPAASAEQSFDENDVVEDSLGLVRVLLPVDMTQSDVVVGKRWFRGGPLANGAQFQSLFKLDDRVTYSATTPPLDDDPTLAECRKGVRFETIFSDGGVAADLAVLYGKKIGIFEVTINHLGPSALSIGSTIRLTHARYGWRQWGSMEASPDNSTSIDSRNAVVLGKEVDLKAKTVRLTLLRQMPGYYPESDFAP